MFDLSHPFFDPMWRRVALTAALLLWAMFEFYNSSIIWGMLFGALGCWCAWSFFFAYRKAEERENGAER